MSAVSVTEAHLARIRRIAPWLVAVGFFMEQMDSTVLNTVVPVISADLGVKALSMKAVVTAYTLSLAVFIPISGWMADRFGTRRVFRAASVRIFITFPRTFEHVSRMLRGYT